MTEKRMIVLTQDTRTFKLVVEGSPRLCRREMYLERGTDIVIDEPRPMIYDHRVQVAFHTIIGKEPLWVLAEEMGLSRDEVLWALRTRTALLEQQGIQMTAREAGLYAELERRAGGKSN